MYVKGIKRKYRHPLHIHKGVKRFVYFHRNLNIVEQKRFLLQIIAFLLHKESLFFQHNLLLVNSFKSVGNDWTLYVQSFEAEVD